MSSNVNYAALVRGAWGLHRPARTPHPVCTAPVSGAASAERHEQAMTPGLGEHMPDGLIGHTGFVGSALARQAGFARCCNRANIASIAGESFGTPIRAAARSRRRSKRWGPAPPSSTTPPPPTNIIR